MTSTATPSDPLGKQLPAIQKLIAQGKLPDAAKKLNAASKISPADPRIYLMGSRLAEAAGNPAGAQDAARRAVSLAPHWPVAVTELAFLLARQNQLKEAVTQAQRAMELDGDNPQVLARVIDIAHRAQHFELAIQWLRRALAQAPGAKDIQLLLARDLRLTGKLDESLALYDEFIGASPTNGLALMGRAQTALARGDLALARKDCETLLELVPGNDEVLFYLDLANGKTPAHQPAAMVRSLYDGFAELYDQHVVAGLKYKLPRDVGKIISERYAGRGYNVLDLGCGTGLLGACLGRIDGFLVGVEVSPPMIEQAARHKVYDKFHNVDLLDALAETPDALYDVVAALDVFIYAGDMGTAIPNALRILRPGGHFIFSCEEAAENEADLVLRPSRRYAHKASHIETLCRAAGFDPVKIERMPLRYENNEPIQGFLVIAQKAG
ncbi:MAG: tetratricopeptide repeat protein [Ramlibacter sp.]